MGNELGQEGLATKGKVTPYKPPAKVYDFSKNTKKSINQWSKNDVKDYMTSLTYTATTRNVVDKKISGKDLLLCRNPEQLSKKLGIPKEKAEGLFELMQIQKQREMAKKFKNMNEDEKNEQGIMVAKGMAKGVAKGIKKVDYNVNFMGSNGWKGRSMIDWTPYNVKSWFVHEFGNVFNADIKKKILDKIDEYVINGEAFTNIEDGKGLSNLLGVDTNIANKIYKAFENRLSSEMDEDDEKKKEDKKDLYRIRTLRWRKYKFIKLSTQKDCIMGYNDDDGIDRAEMPCKHAIAADTMYFYIKSIIEKNKKAVTMFCPVPNCKQEWDWNTCLRIADMNEKEIMKYNLIKTNRMNKGEFKECPNPSCRVKVKRPEKLNQFRVNCSRCKGGDFCFLCTKSWKGSGKILCGNSECKIVSSVNRMLQECPSKSVSYLTCQIPTYRACPSCLTIIQHMTGCKHMNCKSNGCGTSFCFICLGIEDKKTGWSESCGKSSGHTNQCAFAPRQYFT